MGLLSRLKGQSGTGGERPAATETDPVQVARARSRRRLIGAAVLLGVGVIGFPILFETQPRPVPVDLPVDIPRKEGAPSLPLPPPRVAAASAATPRVASGVIAAERAPEPKREAAAPAARPAEPTPQAKPVEPAKPAEAPKAVAAAKPSPPPAPADDGTRAKALLEGKPLAAASAATVAEAKPKAPQGAAKSAAAASGPPADKAADAATGRFVVQVAAYAEMGSARDMRQRVEKLGLKSFTQVVEIDGATRIRVRVGPYTTRDDADKAAATLKAAGLPAAVLTL